MKILWITQLRLDISLSKTTWLETIQRLINRGNEVCLIATSRSGRKDCFGFNERVIKYLPVLNRFYLSNFTFHINLFFLMCYYLIFIKPDIVLVQSPSVFSVIPFALLSRIRLLKCKFVMDIRTVPVDFSGVKGKFKDMEYKASLIISKYLFNGLTVITPQLRRIVHNEYHISEESIGVWSSGVSQMLFDKTKLSHIQKDQKKFIVMYHGILSPNRGLQQTIEAIKILKSEYPDIVFFLLGNGPAKAELEKLIKKLGLENNVVMQDKAPYESVPQYIANADTGILPLPDISWWRVSSPLKLMEYMAMEKPVIVTDIEAHREIIGQSLCGFYIPSNKSQDIAQGIITAYKNREKLCILGKEGKRIVEKRFTWDRQVACLENYLNGVITEQAKILRKNRSVISK